MAEKNKNILIIDDSNTNVILLEAILKNKGYNVEKALSVREANRIILKAIPDLILLDLRMPHISGYKFLEDIRNSERTKNIPVIIVSAIAESESQQKIQRFGIVDYIEKPINLTALTEIVEKSLPN